jgi:hypothetical protein
VRRGLINADVEALRINGEMAVVGLAYSFNVRPYSQVDKTSVHVFSRRNGRWIEDQVLESDAGYDVDDSFGQHQNLAIDGDTIVIGDRRNDVVYIYVQQDGVWTMQAKLTGEASDTSFGMPVGIRGDRVAIGASSSWDTTDQIRIFRRSGSAWHLEASPMVTTLDEPNIEVSDFGASFAFDDGTDRLGVLFRVYYPDRDVVREYGAVFQNVGGAWTQQGRHFEPPQPTGLKFGWSKCSSMSEGIFAFDVTWSDGGGDDGGDTRVYFFEYSQSQNEWVSTGDVISGLLAVNDMAMQGRRLVLAAYKNGSNGVLSSTYIYARAHDETWQLTGTLSEDAQSPIAVSGDRIAARRYRASVPSACVYSRRLPRELV